MEDVRDRKQVADAVLVQSPQILGDSYGELVANLDKLAGVGLAVVVVPLSERRTLDPRRN